MVFPEKAYDRLYSMWERWGISQEDVYYFIENDLLRVCVWLPLRYVERGVIETQENGSVVIKERAAQPE